MTFFDPSFGGTAQEEGGFPSNTGPDGTIIHGPVVIRRAEFQRRSSGYFLYLALSDVNYRNTQNSVYTSNPIASGGGKLQSPYQLPPYIIRVLKKTPPPNGISNSSLIQSLWQPYGNFNNQLFSRSAGPDFTATGLGVGITPYVYWFTGGISSYLNIAEIDGSEGTGEFEFMLDADGGVTYPQSKDVQTAVLPGTEVSGRIYANQNTPFQQFVSGNMRFMRSDFLPTYKYCKQFNYSSLFTEPGAYMVVIMRNSIDNYFSGGIFRANELGNPTLWSVSTTNNTTPSLSVAYLVIEPTISPLTQADGKLSFTVNGYGSVNNVGNVSGSPSSYRWAITNMYKGTPNFATSKMPYNSTTLSSTHPQGLYDGMTFVPSNRFDAYNSLTVETDVVSIQAKEQSLTSFNVGGAFLYDFRISGDGDNVFNPYANTGANVGYVNFSPINTDIDTYMTPSFTNIWTKKLYNNPLILSDATVFTPTGTLSSNSTKLVVTQNPVIIPTSIDIPIQLNIVIENQENSTDKKYMFKIVWTDTISDMLTTTTIGAKNIIRIYKRSATIQNPQNGSEFTSNSVANYRYSSITNSGAVVPSGAVVSTQSGSTANIVYAGKETLTTSGLVPTGTNYWTEDEILGSWLVVLQRNFTPSPSSAVPLIVTSATIVTLANPPNPVIEIVNDTYNFPMSLDTKVGGTLVQNITYGTPVNSWSKQVGTNPEFVTISGLENTPNPQILSLGDPPFVIKNNVSIDIGLNGNSITEDLSGIGSVTAKSLSGDLNAKYDATSLAIEIPLPVIPPVTLSINTFTILDNSPPYGKSFVFQISWDEPFQQGLTTNKTGAKNVIRVYKYQENGSIYEFVPQSYAMYRSDNNSGNNVSNAYLYLWGSEPTTSGPRNIFMDRYGYVSTNPAYLNFGFSEADIQGNWLFILQRNFSTASRVNIVTQGCYYLQLPTPPTLSLTIGTDSIERLATTPTDMFPSIAKNKWFAKTLSSGDAGSFIVLGEVGGVNTLESQSSLTISQLQPLWPLSNGPSYIQNQVTLDLSVSNPSSYTENLGGLGSIETTGIRSDGQTSYVGTSNNVVIYEPSQTNSTDSDKRYLTDVTYSSNVASINDNQYTYFNVSFNDPNVNSLLDNAYTINIFKKGSGSSLEHQWNHPITNFSYVDSSNQGKSITKNDIPTNGGELQITADGTVTAHIKGVNRTITGNPGTFEPGAYLVIIRRNFGIPIETDSSIVLPYYTINSGYIYVLPSEFTLTDSLSFTTPNYGSFNSSGSVNIGVKLNVKVEGVEDPVYSESNAYNISNNVTSNNITVTINTTTLTSVYPADGPISFLAIVSYDWSAPQNLTFPIGKVGSGNGYANAIQPTNSNRTVDGITMGINQINSTLLRIILPSNNSWNYTQGNTIREAKASFTGDANNRLLAIRWEDMRPSDLLTSYTGYPYALRLYKKRKEGNTASEQWYQPPSYNGGTSVYYADAKTTSKNGGKPYEGVPVSATYLPLTSLPRNAQDKKIVYIYADRDGHIWDNAPPTKEEKEDLTKYHPFTDADDAGGYVLVIQRNFGSDPTKPFISTHGIYLSLMPTVSWELTTSGPYLVSTPDSKYTTYAPGYTVASGGTKDITYSWNLALPNIGYSNIIPGVTGDEFDIDTFKATFKNRDKSAVITSNVVYNFSVVQMPFMEAYPLLTIQGDGFFEATSQPYIVDLCVKPTTFPPPPWSRFTPPCPNVTTQAERDALQMRRKAETLRHVSNKHQRRFTKSQQYSYVAQGYNQKRQTYATQTDSYTNPNTKNYPILGQALVLPDQCAERVLTFPSSASDVPGPVVPLTYDPNVPLINYVTVRTYNNSLTEYYDEKGE